MRRRIEPERADRGGRLVLLAIFVVLLGGRYTLGRLDDLPDWDLRWAGLIVVVLLYLAWGAAGGQQRTPVRAGALSSWFAVWAAWMAATSAWAPAGARVGSTLLDLFFLVVLVGAGWSVAGRLTPPAIDAIWWWLYGAGWIYAAGAIAAGPDEQGRYAAFGGGPNVFVRVMALAVLATLFLAVIRRRHAVLVGLVPFLYGTYMSGSRGGVLALLVVVLVGGAPLVRRMSRETRTVIVLGAIVVGLLAPFLYRPSWFAFLQQRFVEQTLEQGYDSQRGEIVERALGVFLDHPLFGAGLDGFHALHFRSTQFEYPHNLPLATAAEGGVVGGLLLVAALVAAGVALHRRRPLAAESLGLGLAALFMLVAAMFSGDYYDSRFLWFFAGLAIIRADADSSGRPGDPLAGTPGRLPGAVSSGTLLMPDGRQVPPGDVGTDQGAAPGSSPAWPAGG